MQTENLHNSVTLLLSTTGSGLHTMSEQNTTESSQSSSSGSSPSLSMRFTMETCIALPVATLGIAGNLLALMVLARIKPRQTTNVWLLSVVVAETMVLVLTVLLRSLRYLAMYMDIMQGYMDVYHWLFIILMPGAYISRLAVQWLCVMLTFDRFVAVCRPLHASVICTLSRTYRYLAAIIVSVLVFSLPRFFEYKYDPSVSTKFSATKFSESNYYTVIYKIILFSLIIYIIPVVSLIIMNRRLVLALRQAETFRGSIRSSLATDHSTPAISMSRSVTALVVAVVCLALTSSSIAFTAQLLYSLEHINRTIFEGPRRFVSLFSNLVVTMNSAVNIFIYFYFSRKFRRQLCIMVCPSIQLAKLRCNSNYSSSSLSAQYWQRQRSSTNSAHNWQSSLRMADSNQRWSDVNRPSGRWSDVSIPPQRRSDTTRPTPRWSASSRQSTSSGGGCERMLLHRTSQRSAHGSGRRGIIPKIPV